MNSPGFKNPALPPVVVDNSRDIHLENTHERLVIHSSWDSDTLKVRRNMSISGGFEITLDEHQWFEVRKDYRDGKTILTVHLDDKVRRAREETR